MNAADGEAECVGGVVWPWGGVEGEQALDHVLDLAFIGAAVSGDGGLALGGAEFGDGASGLFGGEGEYAARLRDRDAVGDVLLEVEFFDGDERGGVRGDEARGLFVNAQEAGREGESWRGGDDAVSNVAEASGAFLDDSESGGCGAGVEAEDAQG